MTLWYYNVYGCRGWRRLAKLRLGVENSERLIHRRRLLSTTKLLIHYPSLWISSFKPSSTADTNFGQFGCVPFFAVWWRRIYISLSLTSVAWPPSERHVSQGSTRVMNSFCLYNKSADSFLKTGLNSMMILRSTICGILNVYIYIWAKFRLNEEHANQQNCISHLGFKSFDVGKKVCMWSQISKGISIANLRSHLQLCKL